MDASFAMLDINQKKARARRPQYSSVWRWLSGMISIILVTAIWGYSNVIMRQGVDTMAPTVLLWMRFGVAGLLMLPALIRIRLPLRSWLTGLGTGVLLGVAVLAQCFAMLTIPVDEVAFITALYVVFTPLGVSIIERIAPLKRVWLAIFLSLVGVGLLIGKLTLHLQIGVFWSVVAAIGLAGQIIGTKSLANRLSSVRLASLQSVGAGAALTIAVLLQGFYEPHVYRGLLDWSATQWYWIGFLIIIATVLAVFMQAWGQARVSATEAALAFNMEPVWTVVFAWAILAQGMTAFQAIGAILIVGSLTLASKPTKKA